MLLTALLAALLSSACKPKNRDERFVEPLTSRPYRVISPPLKDGAPDAPRPVLFSLHPYQTAPEVIVDHFGLVRHAVDTRGFLLVVPEGKKDSGGKPAWNATAACCGDGPRPNDLAYLQAVLRDLKKHFKVDDKRVYALGMSNGGFMAQQWACAPAGEIAAVISLSGAFSGPDDAPCKPTRRVSLIEVHGTADDIIRYEGGTYRDGKRHPSARETVAAWVGFNGLSKKSPTTEKRSEAGKEVEIETWTSDDQTTVSLWTLHGSDHFVPSAPALMPDLFKLYDR